MIDRKIDEQDRIILIASIGTATRVEIDAHFDALRETVAEMRRAGQPIRVLSDQTHAVRLSDELNLHIKAQMDRTYRAGDRVALLLATADDKRYVRAILGVEHYASFTSRIPAEMWLMEPDLPPPAARPGF